MSGKVSKRVGGYDRSKIARAELKDVFSDTNHELYFAKDIELAKKYDVTRHTIYKIRDELKVPSRSQRIVEKIKTMNIEQFTLKALAAELGIKYQNLYKLIKETDRFGDRESNGDT